MERSLNRPIEPAGPASAYKTYQVARPVSTHYRAATCEEVDCPAYINGWSTTIDLGTDLGKQQANYIRRHSGRAYSEDYISGTLVKFTFTPGQKCFQGGDHRLRLDREPVYLVRDGDYRGNPLRTRPVVHSSAQSWLEDFAEHQNWLKEQLG